MNKRPKLLRLNGDVPDQLQKQVESHRKQTNAEIEEATGRFGRSFKSFVWRPTGGDQDWVAPALWSLILLFHGIAFAFALARASFELACFLAHAACCYVVQALAIRVASMKHAWNEAEAERAAAALRDAKDCLRPVQTKLYLAFRQCISGCDLLTSEERTLVSSQAQKVEYIVQNSKSVLAIPVAKHLDLQWLDLTLSVNEEPLASHGQPAAPSEPQLSANVNATEPVDPFQLHRNTEKLTKVIAAVRVTSRHVLSFTVSEILRHETTAPAEPNVAILKELLLQWSTAALKQEGLSPQDDELAPRFAMRVLPVLDQLMRKQAAGLESIQFNWAKLYLEVQKRKKISLLLKPRQPGMIDGFHPEVHGASPRRCAFRFPDWSSYFQLFQVTAALYAALAGSSLAGIAIVLAVTSLVMFLVLLGLWLWDRQDTDLSEEQNPNTPHAASVTRGSAIREQHRVVLLGIAACVTFSVVSVGLISARIAGTSVHSWGLDACISATDAQSMFENRSTHL